ncbi:hypothetical protein Y032_0001g457 [Ancylostoma ceylanicum]|uniref:Uncharacterized protein n=1 Tax=Ancylostoma ceylanicum TaxID=53326 RepID=A0A016W6D3_9BILA|nr:hypothetical protein Y032_0001g457 [Ancylostoma ceylanicum]
MVVVEDFSAFLSVDAFTGYIQCIRNDESAQAVHVTPGPLLNIRKTTMKRDTQSRYDDVDCSQAWLPRPLGRTRHFGWTVLTVVPKNTRLRHPPPVC